MARKRANRRGQANNKSGGGGLAGVVNGLGNALSGLNIGGSKPSVRRTRNRRRRGGKQLAPQRGNNALAPVSVGMAVSNTGRGISARQATTDYIETKSFTTLSDGQSLFEYRITPGLFPTMERFASSYQRIRYHRLVFRISAHMPTNSSGGYIAGFRTDPTDKFPSSGLNRKRFVAGTPGSIKNSIWASMTMVITARELDNRLYYTSPGVDLREYSPGSFFLVVDGDVNQAGSLSVSIDYDVTCSQPALDYQVDEESFPARLYTKARMYGYNTAAAWQIGDVESSANVRWADLFAEANPGAEIILKGYQYTIKTSDEAAQDVEYTAFTRYDPKTDQFRAVVPNTREGSTITSWEDVPFQSQTGDKQVYQKDQELEVYQGPKTGNL